MPMLRPACCLCINVHHYAPPRIVMHSCSKPLHWTLGYTHYAGSVLVKVQCQVLNR